MRRLMMLLMVTAMMLVFVAPASADVLEAGGLIAGTADSGLVVAGDPNLLDDPAATADLPPGTDAAGAGNLTVGPFAGGANVPFAVNFADAGVGPVIENDSVAVNTFVGNSVAETGFGNPNADAESGASPTEPPTATITIPGLLE